MQFSSLLAAAAALTAVTASPVNITANDIDFSDYASSDFETIDKRGLFHHKSDTEDICAKEVIKFHKGPHTALGFTYYRDNMGHLKINWKFAIDKKIHFKIIKASLYHENSWKQVNDLGKWHFGFAFDWRAYNYLEFYKKPIEIRIDYDKEGEITYSTNCNGRERCNPIHLPDLSPKHCSPVEKREFAESDVTPLSQADADELLN